MAGMTGKRAAAPAACTICRKPIADATFIRIRKGDDRHVECEYPNGPNGPRYEEKS